jgi:hypothetical protein
MHCGDCDTACRGTEICADSICTCPAGQEDCDGICADLSSDKQHCGDCDTECPKNQICKSEHCGCPEGQSSCDGTCFDLEADHEHCGNCNTKCNGEQQCSNGECLRSPCDKICTGPENVSLGEDGFRVEPLGTSSRCFEVNGYMPTETSSRIVCWNFQGGRSLRVNGQQVACLTGDGVALDDPRAGGYCVQVGAGQSSSAGFLLPTK